MFFNKIELSIFVVYLKHINKNVINFQPSTMYFWTAYMHLANAKALFLGKTLLYCVNFVI